MQKTEEVLIPVQTLTLLIPKRQKPKWEKALPEKLLRSRITGQSRLRLRASHDVSADVNSCP